MRMRRSQRSKVALLITGERSGAKKLPGFYPVSFPIRGHGFGLAQFASILARYAGCGAVLCSTAGVRLICLSGYPLSTGGGIRFRAMFGNAHSAVLHWISDSARCP